MLELGAEAEGIVADARTGLVAVGLRDPDELALVDGRRGEVVRRVALPESPRHLGLIPGGPVLVPAERADALVSVTLPGGAAQIEPVGDFPHNAAAATRADTVASAPTQCALAATGSGNQEEGPPGAQSASRCRCRTAPQRPVGGTPTPPR